MTISQMPTVYKIRIERGLYRRQVGASEVKIILALLAAAVLLHAFTVLVAVAIPTCVITSHGTIAELSCSPDAVERFRPTDTP